MSSGAAAVTDWRLTLRDDAVWAMLPSRLDKADAALLWLTNTIADVDRQLTDAKAVARSGRLSARERADQQEWRAAAVAFKRVCERRKRELAPAVKAARHQQRDHRADAVWKWDALAERPTDARDAFLLGVVAGRTS